MRFHRDDDAQGIVEFALVLPVFLLLVFGIIDLGRMVWMENTLAFAAREGTRYAIVHGSYSSAPCGPGSATYTPPDQDTAVTAAVLRYAIGVPNVTVAAQWLDGDNNRNSRVAVDVYSDFMPLPSQYLMGGAFSVRLRGGSVLVIQN